MAANVAEVTAEGDKYEVTKTVRDGQNMCVVEFTEQPTQEEFVEFGKRYAKEVTRLGMVIDDPFEEEGGELDWRALGKLPKLTSLELYGVTMRQLHLNARNTPNLESLSLSNMNCTTNFGLGLRLALPELTSFSAEHTVMHAGKNMFGLSMSRCPKLESISSYKFRCLDGKNYMVLPKCVGLALYRSECTSSIEILHAPKLESLNVQAAYDLGNVRLYDFPDATLADVEALNRRTLTIAELQARNVGKAKENLPHCTVNTVNMSLDPASMLHLRANERVEMESNNPDDDEFNIMDEFF